jgi:hypothetical protein
MAMPPSNLAPAIGNVIQKTPTANVIIAIPVEIQDGKNLILKTINEIGPINKTNIKINATKRAKLAMLYVCYMFP